MRRFLAVAIVATLAFGCTPPEAVKPSKPANTPASSGTTSASLPLPAKSEVKLVALRVPTMACPHACWPEVKKTLEGQAGVALVQLAKQPNEDEIVDKTVYISFRGDFDAKNAIAALDRVGFEGSEVVQP